MTIYIFLLIYIFSLGGLVSCQHISNQKKNSIFVLWAFGAIFLLYALRASSVGRDLPGYERMYEIAAYYEWFDFKYVYFEGGYILLEKLCTSLNLSFQWFLVIISAVTLFPVARFIKKYSPKPFISTLIYICYIFFEFNMTGIRQAIATSIVLIGYMLLMEMKKVPLFWYVMTVIVASFFHRGAYAALLYVPFHFVMKSNKYVPLISILAVGILVGRSYLLGVIKAITEKSTMNAQAGLYIGLNLIFLIAMGIVFVWAGTVEEKHYIQNCEIDNTVYMQKKFNYCIDAVNIKMFLLSVVILFVFGSDTSVRSYMILNQVVLVQLPRSIETLFDAKSKKMAYFIVVIFLICFFFTNSMIPNSFDIIPYKFFWNQ